MADLYSRAFSALIFIETLVAIFAFTNCMPGTVKVEADNDIGFICQPCGEGSYSDTVNATRCELCKIVYPTDPYLAVESECRPDRNTVVSCRQPGVFFYDNVRRTVLLCTNCSRMRQFTTVNCTCFRDSFCCPRDNMEVVNGTCADKQNVKKNNHTNTNEDNTSNNNNHNNNNNQSNSSNNSDSKDKPGVIQSNENGTSEGWREKLTLLGTVTGLICALTVFTLCVLPCLYNFMNIW